MSACASTRCVCTVVALAGFEGGMIGDSWVGEDGAGTLAMSTHEEMVQCQDPVEMEPEGWPSKQLSDSTDLIDCLRSPGRGVLTSLGVSAGR